MLTADQIALIPGALAWFASDGSRIAATPAFVRLGLPEVLDAALIILAQPPDAEEWCDTNLSRCTLSPPTTDGVRLLSVTPARADAVLLHQVLDRLPAIIHVKGSDGRYRVVNRVAAERWHTKVDDMLGRTAPECFPSSREQQRAVRVDADVLVDGAERSFRTQFDGLEVLGLKSRLKPAPGSLAVLSIGLDAQETARAERAATRHAALLEAIIEHSPEAILTMDAAQTILAFNPAAERLFATDHLRWIGTPARQLLAQVLPTVTAVQDGWHQHRAHRLDGSSFICDVASREILVEGEPIRTLMLRDITDQIAREEELIAAREAALSADRLKSQFLALLGHELRTPLHSIIGFAELMRDNAIDSTQTAWTAEILAGASGLLEVLSSMIDLMRIEAGMLTARPTPIDMGRMLRDRKRAWDPPGTAPERVSLHIAQHLPAVMADGPQVRQALDRVIANAVRFGGTVAPVDITAEADGSRMTITIRDHGPGMTPEAIAAALEPFRQVDTRLARAANGLGLGLPIAKGLIGLQGGALTVEPASDHGTRVTITLPTG